MFTHLEWQVEVLHLTDFWERSFRNSEEKKKVLDSILKEEQELTGSASSDGQIPKLYKFQHKFSNLAGKRKSNKQAVT